MATAKQHANAADTDRLQAREAAEGPLERPDVERSDRPSACAPTPEEAEKRAPRELDQQEPQEDEEDLVTQESMESFPASDAPSWTPERV